MTRKRRMLFGVIETITPRGLRIDVCSDLETHEAFNPGSENYPSEGAGPNLRYSVLAEWSGSDTDIARMFDCLTDPNAWDKARWHLE